MDGRGEEKERRRGEEKEGEETETCMLQSRDELTLSGLCQLTSATVAVARSFRIFSTSPLLALLFISFASCVAMSSRIVELLQIAAIECSDQPQGNARVETVVPR
jgi:hypothetical protein